MAKYVLSRLHIPEPLTQLPDAAYKHVPRLAAVVSLKQLAGCLSA